MIRNTEWVEEFLLAIQHQEFVLYYQPLYDLINSTYDGVEGLIRWQHPTKGLLLPESFLSTAEECGLIVEMGEWVIKEACAQIKKWHDKGLFIRAAVNVSEQQLRDPFFVAFITETMQEIGIEPSYLELELNENIIIHEENLIQVICEVSQVGVQISLDDFGAGHTSTSNLKRIPVDRIKIDRTFVSGSHEQQNINFIRSTIELARELNARVLAEGIENQFQLDTLISFACDEGQGSYFSHPLSASEVEKFLLAQGK